MESHCADVFSPIIHLLVVEFSGAIYLMNPPAHVGQAVVGPADKGG
jgi:hypothetical protein